jgi:YesN/AraC family two-component response regulator
MSMILVVEDEHNIRKLMTVILHQSGHDVRIANNGFEALALLQYTSPDVLLTDLNMPYMTGLELIEIARRDFPNLSIIAVSAYTEYLQSTPKESKIHQLAKPFAKQALVNMVNDAILH